MATAVPGLAGTVMPGGANGAFLSQIQDGQMTATVYTLIREEKFAEAIHVLSNQLQMFPRSRAALSLLGYCYYQVQDFNQAADKYEALCRTNPEVDEYKFYYAQSLYKAALYEQATRACVSIENDSYRQRKLNLQASIEYEQDDLTSCKAHLDQCRADDPDTIVGIGAVMYKEGDYEGARSRFTEAMNVLGYQAELAYNIALCHYRMKQLGPAMKYIADIIEKGVREHPVWHPFPMRRMRPVPRAARGTRDCILMATAMLRRSCRWGPTRRASTCGRWGTASC
jgi:tetratricopeptide repeat protein 30